MSSSRGRLAMLAPLPRRRAVAIPRRRRLYRRARSGCSSPGVYRLCNQGDLGISAPRVRESQVQLAVRASPQRSRSKGGCCSRRNAARIRNRPRAGSPSPGVTRYQLVDGGTKRVFVNGANAKCGEGGRALDEAAGYLPAEVAGRHFLELGGAGSGSPSGRCRASSRRSALRARWRSDVAASGN